MLPYHLVVLIASRSHGQPLLLERCLRSVTAACEMGSGHWRSIRVVLMDDDSDPPLIRSLSPTYRSLVQVYPNRRLSGQAGALNCGMAIEPADIYAFTDSDCVVSEDWLRQLAEGYRLYPGCSAIVGPNWCHLGASDTWRAWLTNQESRLARGVFLKYVDSVGNASRIDCRNLSLRDDFVRAVAPSGVFFVEESGASVSGTTSIKLRSEVQKRSEYRIVFDPDLSVRHEPVKSLKHQISRYYRLGRGGMYDRTYRRSGKSLIRSFVAHHFVRHFVGPCMTAEHVSLLYLWAVHGAYWAGIFRSSLARSQA